MWNGYKVVDADAHMLYQDIARDALGVESLITDYGAKARAKPDDAPISQCYSCSVRSTQSMLWRMSWTFGPPFDS